MLNNKCKGCSGAELLKGKWTCTAEGGSFDCLGVKTNNVNPQKTKLGKFEEMVSNQYAEYGIREITIIDGEYVANIYSVNSPKSIYMVTADSSLNINKFYKIQ